MAPTQHTPTRSDGSLRRLILTLAITTFFIAAMGADAQTLTVFDDALQNSYQDYSFGGGSDFASTAQAHSGTKSVAFTGNNYNAVSFARPAPDVTAAAYPVLRFWVHGGATGGQQLRIIFQRDALGIIGQAVLDSYITGGALVSGAWREVVVPIAPLAASFDRIDLQSDQGPAQGVLYIDDVVLGQNSVQPVSAMQIEQGVTVESMVSDRFTWKDSNGQPRVAVLAQNSGQVGPGGSRGGALREFRYQLSNGATRILTVTTYGNSAYSGFGYVVSHPRGGMGCVGGDSSGLGFLYPGNGFVRVFEGPHHAIFRFKQNYPRLCDTGGGAARTIPVTIDWLFRTGQDNPLWAITYDVDQTSTAGGAIAPVNTLFDDSRAPYGELNIDGEGWTDLDGSAWGDRWKFTTTSSPISVNSTWTWTAPNTVPYVKEWLAGPLTVGNTKDATIGVVQTQTLDQQDAGGARDPSVGSDIRPFWQKTSVDGNACGVNRLPCGDDWPYQANGNSVEFGANNARMAWKTQYGFLGQQTYTTNNGGPVMTAPGYPKKSYSTYIVLGTHTTSPVEAQLAQVETMQTLTLSATVGSVVTSGPGGVARADSVTYAPAGYNHVYGALAFSAAGNQVDGNIGVGAGTLKKPLVIVSNYSGAEPLVKLGGVTLTADVDYFASLRAAASEYWITLNRDLSGATNHLEILGSAPAGVPAAPTGVSASAVTATRVDVTWNAVAGASSYQVYRKAAGGSFVSIGTPASNSYSDLTATAGAAFLYRVRAVNGSGPSSDSASDLATTVIFTNTPLTTAMKVKAVDLAELRVAVNAVRSLAGAGDAVFTDAAAAGLTIKGMHVTQLRTGLDEARATLGLAAMGYTDPVLAGVKVKLVHFQELRDGVQ